MAASRRCIPRCMAALLGVRDDPEHAAAMREHGIEPIDLLVVNLYPFEDDRRVRRRLCRRLRREHRHRRPGDDPRLGQEPRLCRRRDRSRATTPRCSTRWTLNIGATIAATSASSWRPRPLPAPPAYDAAISGWFADALGDRASRPGAPSAAGWREVMRYGENPHQSAGFYVNGDTRPGVATARQVQGKELSYNNINDTDAAFELVAEFDPARSAAVAIIKHANPCGVAEGAIAAGGLCQGARLRSGLGLRRHRRAQPHARRRGGGRDRRRSSPR